MSVCQTFSHIIFFLRYFYYFYYRLISAIKIGRYTHEKRTKDITEVRKLKLKENQTVDTTSIDVTEQEVDELVARLIVIQEEFCADFRKSFEPGGLLEKHTFVYVSLVK